MSQIGYAIHSCITKGDYAFLHGSLEVASYGNLQCFNAVVFFTNIRKKSIDAILQNVY